MVTELDLPQTPDLSDLAVHIQTGLRAFTCPDDIVEIRFLGIPGRGKRTASGYYDDVSQAASAAAEADQKLKAEGAYFVLNRISPDALPRSPNLLSDPATVTTSDKDILQRRWLLLDLDPDRPSKVSSTDDQLQAASEAANLLIEYLQERQWSEPISAMSGNGHHLLYPIDLANDADAKKLLTDVLALTANKVAAWNLPHRVSLDKGVHSAGQITKLYGTMARKGSSTDRQPHRRSRLLYVPDYLCDGWRAADCVPRERIEMLVAELQSEFPPANRKTTSSSFSSNGESRFLMDRYLSDIGIEFREGGDADYQKWYVTCPFNDSHAGKDAYFFVHASGAYGFTCSHNSCSNNKWPTIKAQFGAPDPQRHFDPPIFATSRTFVELSSRSSQPQHTEADEESGNVTEFPTLTCRDLHEKTFTRQFHVEGLMVAGRPMLIAGPPKSFKTTTTIDLVLSLSAGQPFLGEFNVPEPLRVGMMTTESDEAELKDIVQRVCEAHGYAMSALTAVFSLACPKMNRLPDMRGLERWIERHELKIVAIDPAYKVMPPEDTGNVIRQGDVLSELTELCQSKGATLVLIHHFVKASGYKLDEPPGLLEASGAGYAEWAAQWILMRKRDHSSFGDHKLWLVQGGRGIGERTFGLDVSEGLAMTSNDRRRWQTELFQVSDVIRETEAKADARRRKRQEQKEFEVRQHIKTVLQQYPEGDTMSGYHQLSKVTRFPEFKTVFADFIQRGEVEPHGEIKKSNGVSYPCFRPTKKLTG